MGKYWGLCREPSPRRSQLWGCLSGSLLLLASGCQGQGVPGLSPAPQPSVSLSTSPAPHSLEALEQQIYQQVNQYRRSRKLPPLQRSTYLNQQARLQSEQMASQNRLLGRDTFEDRQSAIANVMNFQSLTANVAMIQGNGDIAPLVLQSWLKDPQLSQNLKGDFELTGLGIGQSAQKNYFITQIFLKKPSPSPFVPPPAPPSPSPANKANSSQANKLPDSDPLILALEISAFQQVNQYRLSKGLAPLRLDPRISNVARKHTQAMAGKKATFSHDGFEQRAKTLKSLIPLSAVGENLAYIKGYSDVVSIAVKGWINSPGHRKNMEGKYNLTGMGVAKNAQGEYYFSQLFVLEP